MRAYIGITDFDWYKTLSNNPSVDEANFWQPSGNRQFKAINPGELFLFKLHSPNDFIVGGGLFARFSYHMPVSLAWEAFGVKNGAISYAEMRGRIEKYRRQIENHISNYEIGCILLEQPFFLQRHEWIPAPDDWKPNIVQGKTYDLSVEPGLSIWKQLPDALAKSDMIREKPAKYGDPVFQLPRLGQGSFRILVTDAYDRRCAVTNERTLPALDAAHIKPFSENGDHLISNGVLLRRDLHALFDKGYITITPSRVVEVSRKIKEEFENGRDYYRHHGMPIHLPKNSEDYPSKEYLEWHNNRIYKG